MKLGKGKVVGGEWLFDSVWRASASLPFLLAPQTFLLETDLLAKEPGLRKHLRSGLLSGGARVAANPQCRGPHTAGSGAERL